MSISSRLQRLERRPDKPVELTFDEFVDSWGMSLDWLAGNGFQDALAAFDAEAQIPAGLIEEMKEQAHFCPRHRAFRRIEDSLNGIGTTTVADWQAFLASDFPLSS